jgi:Asp-tRNA(Asn)/Glu-tRNA(Gln) amidotransferase A subunit family amidase
MPIDPTALSAATIARAMKAGEVSATDVIASTLAAIRKRDPDPAVRDRLIAGGLPVAVVPLPLEPMPIGVQIIAAPWREDIVLRIANALEQMGVAAAPGPPM